MAALTTLKKLAAAKGYSQLNRLRADNAADLTLACEAANYLAKQEKDESFYPLKRELALAAIAAGATAYWSQQEADKHGHILLLSTPETGTASIHIPMDEMEPFAALDLEISPYPWHGVYRQQWVLEVLASPFFQWKMAMATQLGAKWENQPVFAMGHAANLRTKISF